MNAPIEWVSRRDKVCAFIYACALGATSAALLFYSLSQG